VLPIFDIYRRYYGLKIAALLLVVSYAAIAGAAYVVEMIFGIAGLVPQHRSAQIVRLTSHGITRLGSTSRSSAWLRSWYGVS
jgi:hypothetical protein